MAFLGGSWDDEKNEKNERDWHMGPLSHWDEDLDDSYESLLFRSDTEDEEEDETIMSKHFKNNE